MVFTLEVPGLFVLLFAQSGLVQLLLCGEETDNTVSRLVENPHSRYSVTSHWGSSISKLGRGVALPVCPIPTSDPTTNHIRQCKFRSHTVTRSLKLSFLAVYLYLSGQPMLFHM